MTELVQKKTAKYEFDRYGIYDICNVYQIFVTI